MCQKTRSLQGLISTNGEDCRHHAVCQGDMQEKKSQEPENLSQKLPCHVAPRRSSALTPKGLMRGESFRHAMTEALSISGHGVELQLRTTIFRQESWDGQIATE